VSFWGDCECEDEPGPTECFECGSREGGVVTHIDGFGRGCICGDCWPEFKRNREAKRAAALAERVAAGEARLIAAAKAGE